MMLLHDYWRSDAAYRVRLGLSYKGVAYEVAPHDLRIGALTLPAFASLNPQKLVPALQVGERVFTQSLAILELLEELHPAPPLLPRGAADRAVVRAMAGLVVSDVHPLANLRVLNRLRQTEALDETVVRAWAQHWLREGFEALETQIEKFGGAFAFGDQPSLADCCILPQLYSASRFDIDTTVYPGLARLEARLSALRWAMSAHPDRNPFAG